MRRFLTSVFAFMMAAPSAQAGSVWLIIKEGVYSYGELGITMEKIEMKDMDQCEEQGAVFISSKRLGKSREKNYSGFECLEGK
jgi:hypothetical protein